MFQASGLPEIQRHNTGSLNTHTGRLEQGELAMIITCPPNLIFIFSHIYYLCPLTSAPLFQVLVPLVLLQALQSEGQPLSTLLQMGVRLLEEDESDYILQQGGWVSFF